MSLQTDQRRAKRELRLGIGRLRRRIDGRIRSAGREGRRLLSWRTYVRRYPVQGVLTALGLGLAASGGLGGGWSRFLGRRLAARAVRRALGRMWREVEEIWAASKPAGENAETRGAEDG